MKANCQMILIVLVFFMIFTPSAYAYLDPGTGSMLMQLLLGGVAGLVIIIKLYWYRILTFWGIKKDNNEQENKLSDDKHQN